MKANFTFALLLCVLGCAWGAIKLTALDDYVYKPDPHYGYEILSTTKTEDYTQVVINMTSQAWLTKDDVNQNIWFHYLTICIPTKQRDTNIGFMYIDGGDNTDPPPTNMYILTYAICMSSKTVVGYLQQIPNQPLYFTADPLHKRRVEDEEIAFTWWHFINNTTQPEWLNRLPMTKGAVRAMDTIETVTASMPGVIPVKKFVVAGASKRGWTTWTVGAVEYNKRVVGIVPMVIPVLKMQENFNHIWRTYGEWPFALDDYLDMGIMNYLNKPVFNEMAAIIDPFSYNDRFVDMPKYLLFATDDEFFSPDQPNVFFNDVKGETYARMLPNTEHALAPDYWDVGRNIETFYWTILANKTRPTFDFELIKSNTTAKIIVKNCNPKPTSVYMWHATTLSTERRDFRLLTCKDVENCVNPVFWYDKELSESSPGVWEASQDAPPEGGWTGFLIEVIWTYDYNWDLFAEYSDFKATTLVNIVPDILPFPPCGDNCQPAPGASKTEKIVIN
mmetsp:Transcript_16579/g.18441  ORF Transcript_16579/g.18441 Transcript_16579/m.18441 type:complete len:503 (-) Transcript_16579:24-1532(-)